MRSSAGRVLVHVAVAVVVEALRRSRTYDTARRASTPARSSEPRVARGAPLGVPAWSAAAAQVPRASTRRIHRISPSPSTSLRTVLAPPAVAVAIDRRRRRPAAGPRGRRRARRGWGPARASQARSSARAPGRRQVLGEGRGRSPSRPRRGRPSPPWTSTTGRRAPQPQGEERPAARARAVRHHLREETPAPRPSPWPPPVGRSPRRGSGTRPPAVPRPRGRVPPAAGRAAGAGPTRTRDRDGRRSRMGRPAYSPERRNRRDGGELRRRIVSNGPRPAPPGHRSVSAPGDVAMHRPLAALLVALLVLAALAAAAPAALASDLYVVVDGTTARRASRRPFDVRTTAAGPVLVRAWRIAHPEALARGRRRRSTGARRVAFLDPRFARRTSRQEALLGAAGLQARAASERPCPSRRGADREIELRAGRSPGLYLVVVTQGARTAAVTALVSDLGLVVKRDVAAACSSGPCTARRVVPGRTSRSGSGARRRPGTAGPDRGRRAPDRGEHPPHRHACGPRPASTSCSDARRRGRSPEAGRRVFLHAHQPAYRPGERVEVRGIVRSVGASGARPSTRRCARSACGSWRRATGVLGEAVATVSAGMGTFAAGFDLPAGRPHRGLADRGRRRGSGVRGAPRRRRLPQALVRGPGAAAPRRACSPASGPRSTWRRPSTTGGDSRTRRSRGSSSTSASTASSSPRTSS